MASDHNPPVRMNASRRLLIGLGVTAAALAGASVSNSRVDLMATTGRLPAYRSVDYGIGHSQEFGSVYVTDAIGSADFNRDGLPDVVYATANSGSTSTFAMQFALNRGRGRFIDGATSFFDGAVPRTQVAVGS